MKISKAIHKDLINIIKVTAKETGWKVIQYTVYRREGADFYMGHFPEAKNS